MVAVNCVFAALPYCESSLIVVISSVCVTDWNSTTCLSPATPSYAPETNTRAISGAHSSSERLDFRRVNFAPSSTSRLKRIQPNNRGADRGEAAARLSVHPASAASSLNHDRPMRPPALETFASPVQAPDSDSHPEGFLRGPPQISALWSPAHPPPSARRSPPRRPHSRRTVQGHYKPLALLRRSHRPSCTSPRWPSGCEAAHCPARPPESAHPRD
jgi:hypothetical protein